MSDYQDRQSAELAMRDYKDKRMAEAAKDEGMEAAGLGGYDPLGWRNFLLGCVLDVAERKEFFVSDDIFDLAGDYTDQQHSLLVLGSVMQTAARRKWCKKSQQAPRNSERVGRHAGPMTVWESLIYEQWLAEAMAS